MGADLSAPAVFGSAASIAASVAAGDRSAADVIGEHLDRIEQHDGDVHAYNLVTAEAARVAAEELDARLAAGEEPGPLVGVPVAIKDNMCMQGVPTTCSSKILEGWQPPYTCLLYTSPSPRDRG